MWAWEVLRRVVRNTDRVVQNTEHLIRSTDGVARSTDAIARTADGITHAMDGVARTMEGIAQRTDGIVRNADGLSAVVRCLNEIAELQKAQLVMLREQSESLHELTASITRLMGPLEEKGKPYGADNEAAAVANGAPASEA
jgi:methyl-accepting chemotaxis protein